MGLELDIAGKLFPNIMTMAVQLLATGVLFWGFKKLLWVPMQNYLQKRADVADQALRDAHEAKLLAEQRHKEAEALLS